MINDGRPNDGRNLQIKLQKHIKNQPILDQENLEFGFSFSLELVVLFGLLITYLSYTHKLIDF